MTKNVIRVLLIVGLLVVTYGALVPRAPMVTAGIDDKFQHFMAYALLAVTAHFAFPSKVVTTTLLLIAYGGILEGIQYLVPGRDMSLADGLANITGVAVAFVLVCAERVRNPVG